MTAAGWRAGRAGWAADDRHARAALSFLADPGDQVLGALLRLAGPCPVLAAVLDTASAADAGLAGTGLAGTGLAGTGLAGTGLAGASPGTVARAIGRWRSRLGQLPWPGHFGAWEEGGFRLACPGEPEWPTQLDDLGEAQPVVLWLRGSADLRHACLRSVSVVGSRAATAYGDHVAGELAADLAGSGWTVISGGAYGIDASAHRGALAVGGRTVCVLASGLTFGYPKGHHDLFEAIAGTGVLVSERPPDQAPTRPGFLVRNRIIAALSRGTVVVEAAPRSGALNTARQAGELHRFVMAVPGPVTSQQSAGCHELIRERDATLVTCAREVVELVASLGGEDGAVAAQDAVVPAAGLDPVTAAVLGAVPQRVGRGPATIATLAGVDLDTAMRCLGLLAAAGHIERCEHGWRARKGAR